MKNFSRPVVALLFSALVFSLACPVTAEEESSTETDIRQSILAGNWYPGSRAALRKAIKSFMTKASSGPLPAGEIKAVIVPHAGYRYSGQVAADAFRLLEGSTLKRVILIGPSHRMRFNGASVNLQSGYETPLGVVPVDLKFCRELMKEVPNMEWIKDAHLMEHCLEIQLPFLQTTLKDFKIVPILLSEMDFHACQRLADAIVKKTKGKGETLILASTDLSHFHPSDRAEALDRRFISRIEQLDPKGLAEDIASGKCEACGHNAAVTVLLAALGLGVDRAAILSYSHSGQTTGDNRSVVGYLSAALIRSYYRDPHQKK